MESESDYRRRVQETFDRIETAMESADPDLAECEQALGALTITLGGGAKCILSAQPSVRQLWLALARDGIAYHFNFEDGVWLDDKGKGIELIEFLEGYLGKVLGGKIKL